MLNVCMYIRIYVRLYVCMYVGGVGIRILCHVETFISYYICLDEDFIASVTASKEEKNECNNIHTYIRTYVQTYTHVAVTGRKRTLAHFNYISGTYHKYALSRTSHILYTSYGIAKLSVH